jgi:hypothetical protein
MHQRSRKVLIFLVVVFLAIHIACIVIGTIDIMYVAEGTLQLWTEDECAIRLIGE